MYPFILIVCQTITYHPKTVSPLPESCRVNDVSYKWRQRSWCCSHTARRVADTDYVTVWFQMMSAETTWPITLPLSRRSASSLRISVIQATRPKHHGMPQTPLDPAGLHGERGATEWRVERPAFKRLNSRSLSTFERRKSRYVKNVFKPVTKECISERAFRR